MLRSCYRVVLTADRLNLKLAGRSKNISKASREFPYRVLFHIVNSYRLNADLWKFDRNSFSQLVTPNLLNFYGQFETWMVTSVAQRRWCTNWPVHPQETSREHKFSSIAQETKVKNFCSLSASHYFTRGSAVFLVTVLSCGWPTGKIGDLEALILWIAIYVHEARFSVKSSPEHQGKNGESHSSNIRRSRKGGSNRGSQLSSLQEVAFHKPVTVFNRRWELSSLGEYHSAIYSTPSPKVAPFEWSPYSCHCPRFGVRCHLLSALCQLRGFSKAMWSQSLRMDTFFMPHRSIWAPTGFMVTKQQKEVRRSEFRPSEKTLIQPTSNFDRRIEANMTRRTVTDVVLPTNPRNSVALYKVCLNGCHSAGVKYTVRQTAPPPNGDFSGDSPSP